MIRGLALLCAGAVMLAAGHAQAEGYGFDSGDILGGGPNFRSGGYGGRSPIPRTTVTLQTSYGPGTILINTSERRLYLVLPGGQALRYGIGVGRDGFRWSGTHRISAKKEWPAWTPPPQMLRRRPDLPRHMPGGVENPLGARAMYLGPRSPHSRQTSPRRSVSVSSAASDANEDVSTSTIGCRGHDGSSKEPARAGEFQASVRRARLSRFLRQRRDHGRFRQPIPFVAMALGYRRSGWP